MSDLDEDLLALAGAGSATESDDEPLSSKRTGDSPDRSERKKKKVVEEEDAEEDDDDYDIGGGDDYNDEESEDDYDPINQDEGEEEDENPYPLEGKYKNEKDRAELEAMLETERESILFDRQQELIRIADRKSYREKMARNNQLQNERATRAKKVKESAKSVKSSVRSQLKKQRQKKNKETSRYSDDDEDDQEEEEEEDEEEDDGYDFEDVDEEFEPDFSGSKSAVEWAESSKRKEVDTKDINSIRTGHSVAEKYCFYPGFDEVIVGTFGKIRVNKNEHRMVRIDAVVSGKPYVFGESKVKTNQYFTLSQPGKDRKNFQFGFLSDEYIKPEEFYKYKQYVQEARKAGKSASLPSVTEIQYKFKELKEFSSQKLEGEVFNQYMAKKSKFNTTSAGTNFLNKKLKLKQQLEIASSLNDHRQVAKLKDELRHIDEHFRKANTTKSTSLTTAKLSERNRKINNSAIRQAELRNTEKKRSGTAVNSDPFARLTTRAKVYYHEAKKQENDQAKIDALKAIEENAAKEAKEIELLRSAKYRSLGELDKLIGSIDYKFDIEI